MKPAAFDYARPATLDEAVGLLAASAGEAKVLAGGQSLVPLLNFRMLRPALLVDINRIADLRRLEPEGRGLRIGALTRHHALETSALVRARFPVLAEAMRHVAHLAIRNRGTIGGSLTHADPAAELPMMALLLDAEILARGPDGAKSYRAADFFLGPLTSALGEDEIVTEVVLPGLPDGAGWAFEEVSQRAGDFAIAAAAAILALDGERVVEARLALTGVDETPLRLREIEAGLRDRALTRDAIADAAAAARVAVEPSTDLRASADYRRHLVGVLVERVLIAARDRAGAALR